MFEFAALPVDPVPFLIVGGLIVGLAAGRHWVYVAAGAVLVAIVGAQSPIEGASPWTVALLIGLTFAVSGAVGGIARVKLVPEWKRERTQR
jgi:hypothetical protein